MAIALSDLSRGVVNAMELRCPGLTMPVMSIIGKSEHDYTVVLFPDSERKEAVTRLTASASAREWQVGSDGPLQEGVHSMIIYHSKEAIAFAKENALCST